MRNSRKMALLLAQGTLAASLLLPGVALAQSAQPASSPAAPATAGAPTTQTNTQPSGAAPAAFVPLTHFPQITQLANSDGFTTFVNALYRICIGLGSVLAVLMIMVAGVQFMTSRGSVASNEKAKARIQNAILGLILVLAPTIVFTIINPDILNLNLGSEFSGLQTSAINQNAFTASTASGGSLPSSCSDYSQPTAAGILESCSAKFGSSYTQVAAACCSISDPSSAVCCATPKTSQSSDATQYEWKATATSKSNGNLNNLYGLGSSPQTNTQSATFNTQQECQASFSAFTLANSGSTIKTQCDCSEPRSQFPACSQ